MVEYSIFFYKSTSKKEGLEDPSVRWKDNIKIDLQEVGLGAWAGLIWLRIGTGGGHL